MDKEVRAILYGSNAECGAAAEEVKASGYLSDHKYECYIVEGLDELEEAMVDTKPTLVIVLEDGAAGMEGVHIVRNSRPELPVFWFSDDPNFGLHSHRLNCAYFTTKPVTAEKVDRAFRRCIHIGISFDAQ